MKIKSTFLIYGILTFFISMAQDKVGCINVDTTITGFRFATTFDATMIYTQNGEFDRTTQPSAFYVTVSNKLTFDDAKEWLKQLMDIGSKTGYEQTELTEKDTIVNGNKAYYISGKETLKKENYLNLVFYALLIKDDTVVIFTSEDLDRGKYIDKFKETFFTIKL